MIPVFGRLSDKGRAAVHLAFLVALREEKREISSINFLTGIQCASPHLFAGTNLEKLGITPLDVSNLEKIQQEMQRLYMKAGIEHAAEKSDSTMGFSFPFSPTIKLAIETANKYAESSGAKSTGTAHLLFGILKADVDVAGRMERAGLEEARVVEFCEQYVEGDEGESMSEALQKVRGRAFRSGIGYDLHRLEAGRKLIVGGIELPFEKGPVGHSDGDVLAHAMCDALLGAAGLGDIGTHFPDTDPKWKGANSLIFLEHAKKLLEEKRLEIEWIDSVVITEKPKLGPHFPKMREALGRALGVSTDHIHIKAKTNEGVDAIGRGEAIAAHVVATLSQR